MKQIKDKWLGARVDPAQYERVDDYIKANEELTMGDLVRKGVEEYMLNHPVKKPQASPTDIKKPGESQ